MHIQKISKSDLVITRESEYDPVTQTWKFVSRLVRKDGVGKGLVAEFHLPATQLDKLTGGAEKPEDHPALIAAIDERIDCDLAEINHEGHWSDGPMAEEVHDMRLSLGLETIL